MPDTPTLPNENEPNGMSIGTAFTIYPRQAGFLSDMQITENLKRSAIVQDAIELRYFLKNSRKLQELQDMTAQPLLEVVLQAVEQLHTTLKSSE
jgi:hypothetical protein